MNEDGGAPSGHQPSFHGKALNPPGAELPARRQKRLPPIDVVAGVIRRDGLLLIAQRQAGDTLAGYWEFPGGKVERDEDLLTALRRELQEELGVEVSIGAQLQSVVHPYPDRDVRLHFYEVELLRGEPRPIEAADLRWVRPNELLDYQFPEADRPLIEQLRAR